MVSRGESELRKRRLDDSSTSENSENGSYYIPKIAGRLVSLELEDFMCHSNMKLEFDVDRCNCFYIVGPNGSGKSAIFAGLNIGLGGRGRANDRGDNVQSYIKEGRNSARIRIVMNNEGPNRHPSYGKEIVIERVINSTSSNFVLKSRNGSKETVVTRAKTHLDSLLQHMAIELENPLSWLSQDRSRQFLQDMKPEKLYEMFMITTELDSTSRLYSQINASTDQMDKCTGECDIKKEKMKTEYEEMVVRHRAAKQVEQNKKELEQISWLILWTTLRDLDENCREEGERLEKLHGMKTSWERELRVLEGQGKDIGSEIKDFEEKIRALKRETAITTNEHLGIKERLCQCKRLIGDNQYQQRRKKLEIDSADREINQAEGQISARMGNTEMGERNLDEEEVEIGEKKAKLAEKIADAGAKVTEAREVEGKREAESGKIQERIHEVEIKVDGLKRNINKVEDDMKMYNAAKKNRLMVFGMDVPKLLTLIESSNRFRVKPIGPIGHFVKLRETKWASPVEFTLKKLANNFICDSVEDRKELERLCRSSQIRIPDLTVTKFSHFKFDTSSKEPPPQFATILRVIDVSDPTVFNVIVDQLQVEQKLLFEKDDEARAVMREKPPHNSREAVTMECNQAFPASNNKPYRFYANKRFNPRFLIANTTDSGRNFQAEMSQYRRQLQECEKALEEHNAEKKRADEVLKKAKEQRISADKSKKDIEDSMKIILEKYKRIQDMLVSGDLIQNLKAAIEESRRNKARFTDEYERLHQEGTKLEIQKNQIEAEEVAVLNKKKDSAKKIEEIETNVNRCTARHNENQEQIRKTKDKLERCAKVKTRSDEKIEAWTEERMKKEIICNKEKKNLSQPPNFDDPPDFTQLPTTDELTREYKKLEEAIRLEEQRNLDRRDLPTVESIKTFAEDYKKFSKRLRNNKQIVARFKGIVAQRMERFSALKTFLPLKLAKDFEAQMSMRQYSGKLNVDHANRLISISVETHKRQDMVAGSASINMSSMQPANRTSTRESMARSPPQAATRKRMVQDLRGLSGGERSYTTACFIMALWSCVQSPFRCLDEFDIFMDHYNRRVVIEMLMEMATDCRDTQFFFFTPQGVSELGDRKNIQVFKLEKLVNGN